jgi:serine/threonine protein kinase/tetratricopeptide (TPR) repeat protein
MIPDPQQAKAIFLQAVEQHPPEQWPAFLDQACSGQPELRQRVKLLLDAHREAGTAAQPSGDEGPPPQEVNAMAERPGTIIGPYKLLELIGEGGMGTVWMAEQTEPIHRRVAVKVIKAGMDSKQVLARFEAERQALALMDHPNIAKVLDAGTTGGVSPGRPYFVMELVKGTPITKYCDDKHLSVRERLELFGDVCRAVQHAHQKGIIHRDIKPSNILVAPFDGKPVVKVIDFGVAKATGQRLTDATLFTGFGAVVGTPEYMSPEQAETNNQDIDTRSDIYSLGVLLYELLTGSTPLTKKRVKEAALLEVLRVIREEEPPKPSTRLSSTEELPSVAAQRQIEPAKLTKLIRGDLDWIVMKALEKDRNRRYETANGFAIDIQRYLADEPVLACPPSTGYRLRKFVRRNKAAATMAAMFALALLIAVAALSVSTLLTSRAYAAEKTAHGRAEANFQRARGAVHDFFTTVSQNKLLDVPGVQPVRQELLESAVRYYQALAMERDDDPTIQADLALAHLRLAEVYYEVGDNNKAVASVDAGLDLAEQLIQKHPDDRDLLRRLAGFWRGTRRMRDSEEGPNDLVAAERSLNRFIGIWQALSDKNPSERAFRSDLAVGYDRLAGLLDLALRPAESAVAAEKAVAMWESLIREHPKEPEYLSALGDTFDFLRFHYRTAGAPQRELEVTQKAIEVGEKLAALKPTAPAYREHIANSIMAEALALRDQKKAADAEGQYRRALAIWEKLASEYPMNVHYHMKLGHLHVMLDDWEKAIAEYTQAINLVPDRWESWFERAEVYARRRLYERALADCSKAIELNPHEEKPLLLGDVWHHRANMYSILGEADKALAGYSKAAELAPNNFWHWLRRGQAHSRLKQWPKAVADCTRGLALKEDFAELWLTRGDAYAALGQWDKAATDYSEMLKLAPNDYNVLHLRAVAYVKLNQPELAVADLRQAFSKGNKDLDRVRKDEAFATLRHRDDFKKLLTDLDAKKK